MTGSKKFSFFLVALGTMTCFAVASIAMAEGHGWRAFFLFVLAVALTTAGFIAKNRVLKRGKSDR